MSIKKLAKENCEFDLLVMGLGYVGLPLLTAAAEAGLRVVGYDTSPGVVHHILNADSLVHGISLEKSNPLFGGHNVVTTDSRFIARARRVVVCVPTPSTQEHEPNLEFVIQAATAIGKELTIGQLIVLESTVAPGTTTGVFRTTLENQSGLQAGVNFHLAFSPERIDPANKLFNLRNTPKIVGGLTESCSIAARDFYSSFVDRIEIALTPSEAEASKLLENTFRHVNIAFINEFALACRELDVNVHEVIRLASTKPFGFSEFRPSAGAGGHCIPVDPNYFNHALIQRSGKKFEFIELSNKINDAMPIKFAQIALDSLLALGRDVEGSRILVLGLSYKANVPDIRETPAFKFIDLLLESNADVEIHDPHVESSDLVDSYKGLFSRNLEESCEQADLIVVLQNHNAYLGDGILNTYSHKLLSPSSKFAYPHRFSF